MMSENKSYSTRDKGPLYRRGINSSQILLLGGSWVKHLSDKKNIALDTGLQFDSQWWPDANIEIICQNLEKYVRPYHRILLIFCLNSETWKYETLEDTEGKSAYPFQVLMPNVDFVVSDFVTKFTSLQKLCSQFYPNLKVILMIPPRIDVYHFNLSLISKFPEKQQNMFHTNPKYNTQSMAEYSRNVYGIISSVCNYNHGWPEKTIFRNQIIAQKVKGCQKLFTKYMKSKVDTCGDSGPLVDGINPTVDFIKVFWEQLKTWIDVPLDLVEADSISTPIVPRSTPHQISQDESICNNLNEDDENCYGYDYAEDFNLDSIQPEEPQGNNSIYPSQSIQHASTDLSTAPVYDGSFDVSNLNILLVGDYTTEGLNFGVEPGLPHLTVKYIPHGSLDEYISIVDSYLDEKFDGLVLVPFNWEFLTLASLLPNADQPKVPQMKLDIQFDKLAKSARDASEKWNEKFPELKIIWALPYPIDFLKLYEQTVRDYGSSWQPNTEINNSIIFITKKFYASILQLEEQFRKLSPPIGHIELRQCFFLKESILEYSFRHSNPKFPPYCLKENGIDPSFTLSQRFKYALLDKIKELDVPASILNRRKKRSMKKQMKKEKFQQMISGTAPDININNSKNRPQDFQQSYQPYADHQFMNNPQAPEHFGFQKFDPPLQFGDGQVRGQQSNYISSNNPIEQQQMNMNQMGVPQQMNFRQLDMQQQINVNQPSLPLHENRLPYNVMQPMNLPKPDVTPSVNVQQGVSQQMNVRQGMPQQMNVQGMPQQMNVQGAPQQMNVQGVPQQMNVQGVPQQMNLQQGMPQQMNLQQGMPQQMNLQQGLPQQMNLQQGMPQQMNLQQGMPQQINVQQGVPPPLMSIQLQGGPHSMNLPLQGMPQSMSLTQPGLSRPGNTLQQGTSQPLNILQQGLPQPMNAHQQDGSQLMNFHQQGMPHQQNMPQPMNVSLQQGVPPHLRNVHPQSIPQSFNMQSPGAPQPMYRPMQQQDVPLLTNVNQQGLPGNSQTVLRSPNFGDQHNLYSQASQQYGNPNYTNSPSRQQQQPTSNARDLLITGSMLDTLKEALNFLKSKPSDDISPEVPTQIFREPPILEKKENEYSESSPLRILDIKVSSYSCKLSLFFQQSRWKDLFLKGNKSVAMDTLYSAVKAVIMLKPGRGVKVIMITTSEEFIEEVENRLNPIIETSLIGVNNEIPFGSPIVLIDTPTNLRLRLSQSKFRDTSELGALIVFGDDLIYNIRSPASIELAHLIKLIYTKSPSEYVNKVVISESGGEDYEDVASQILGTKFSSKREKKRPIPKENSLSLFEMLAEELEKEEAVELQKKGVNKQLEEIDPKQRMTAEDELQKTIDISSIGDRVTLSSISPISDTSLNDAEDGAVFAKFLETLGPVIEKEYMELGKKILVAHEKQYQNFIDVPVYHPDYKLKRDAFVDTYKRRFGVNYKQSPFEVSWSAFWGSYITELKEEEWSKKMNKLQEKFRMKYGKGKKPDDTFSSSPVSAAIASKNKTDIEELFKENKSPYIRPNSDSRDQLLEKRVSPISKEAVKELDTSLEEICIVQTIDAKNKNDTADNNAIGKTVMKDLEDKEIKEEKQKVDRPNLKKNDSLHDVHLDSEKIKDADKKLDSVHVNKTDAEVVSDVCLTLDSEKLEDITNIDSSEKVPLVSSKLQLKMKEFQKKKSAETARDEDFDSLVFDVKEPPLKEPPLKEAPLKEPPLKEPPSKETISLVKNPSPDSNMLDMFKEDNTTTQDLPIKAPPVNPSKLDTIQHLINLRKADKDKKVPPIIPMKFVKKEVIPSSTNKDDKVPSINAAKNDTTPIQTIISTGPNNKQQKKAQFKPYSFVEVPQVNKDVKMTKSNEQSGKSDVQFIKSISTDLKKPIGSRAPIKENLAGSSPTSSKSNVFAPLESNSKLETNKFQTSNKDNIPGGAVAALMLPEKKSNRDFSNSANTDDSIEELMKVIGSGKHFKDSQNESPSSCSYYGINKSSKSNRPTSANEHLDLYLKEKEKKSTDKFKLEDNISKKISDDQSDLRSYLKEKKSFIKGRQALDSSSKSSSNDQLELYLREKEKKAHTDNLDSKSSQILPNKQLNLYLEEKEKSSKLRAKSDINNPSVLSSKEHLELYLREKDAHKLKETRAPTSDEHLKMYLKEKHTAPIGKSKQDYFEKSKSSTDDFLELYLKEREKRVHQDSKLMDSSKKFKHDNPSKKDKDVEVLGNTLNLLDPICDVIGMMGHALKAIVAQAKSYLPNVEKVLQVFREDDSVTLVNYAIKKMRALSDDSDVHKYSTIIQLATRLLEQAQSSSNTGSGEGAKTFPVDVESIAKATVGKDSLSTYQFINTTYLYRGLPQPPTKELEDVFQAVSQIHFSMAFKS